MPRDSNDPTNGTRRGFLGAVAATSLFGGSALAQDDGDDRGGDDDGDGSDGRGRRESRPPRLIATLLGSNEVPPVDTPAVGRAHFETQADGTLAFLVAIQNISGVTQGHIHEAPPGENGPIVFPLFTYTENVDGTGGGVPRDGPIVETGVVDDTALVDRILSNPSAFYVNVHTTANPAGEIRGQITDPARLTRFEVTVENVSTTETLTPSEGDPQAVPLAPGAFAVHSVLAPLFTPGVPDRGLGLESLAEDGDPSALAASLEATPGVVESGTFTTPTGADSPGPIGPEESYRFAIDARPGQHLSFATMFVPSNDLFFAPGEAGIRLFDDTARPIDDEVTRQVGLWDAGTERNEEPGVGPNQAPRQSGPNTGPSENAPVLPIDAVNDGFSYPAVGDVLRVSVSPTAPPTPTATATSASASLANGGTTGGDSSG